MTEPARCKHRCWVAFDSQWLYPADMDGEREFEATGECLRCRTPVIVKGTVATP